MMVGRSEVACAALPPIMYVLRILALIGRCSIVGCVTISNSCRTSPLPCSPVVPTAIANTSTVTARLKPAAIYIINRSPKLDIASENRTILLPAKDIPRPTFLNGGGAGMPVFFLN